MFDAAHNALQVIMAGSVPRRDALAGVAALAVSMAIASPRHVAAEEPVPLRIGGTGMALAAMRQIGDAFTATQPQTTVKILPSLGTGGGLAAVAAGAIDVAVAARGLNDAERAKGLQCFPYAQTPLAFVTHPDVGVSGVTLTEVAAILAGRRLAWPNGTAIRLIRREPSDADWSLLRTLSPKWRQPCRPRWSGPVCSPRRPTRRMRTRSNGCQAHLEPCRSANCAPNPAASPRSCWMASLRRSRHWPADATDCRALCMSPRASQPTEDVARFLAFLSSEQTGELLMRLGHIPLAGTGT